MHFRLEISSTEIELVRKIAEQAGLKSVTPGVAKVSQQDAQLFAALARVAKLRLGELKVLKAQ